MGQRITIQIRNKIANCLTELPVVCGNSDYEVEFDFDSEWDGHSLKTAVFTSNGKSYQKVFDGNVCDMPAFENTLIVWVGVFAGAIDDGTLSTSTPALVRCIPCITDGDAIPAPPPDDVYNQIIKMLEDTNDAVEEMVELANRLDLLWENASLMSDFGETSIKLPVARDYESYVILCSMRKSDGRPTTIGGVALRSKEPGGVHRNKIGVLTGGGWGARNLYIETQDEYIDFQFHATSIFLVKACTYRTYSNDYCIPFRIYGIKKAGEE